MSDSPPACVEPRRRRIRVWWLLITVIVIGGVVDGARRTPADHTRPISIKGATPATTTDTNILRVATFNIHSGRGTDRRTDLKRTAAVFPSPPDLIGLNEVRGTWHDSLGPDQAAQLGELMGMRSAFIPTERQWWHDHFGNAVLTRLPVHQIHRIPLVGTRGKAFRCAVLIQIEFQHQEIQLLSVHVDSQTDREHQLQSIIDLFLGLHPPALLIGDLNTTSDDPHLQKLLARPDVVDALQDTSPDARGRKHIDWILARGLRCRSGKLIENDASDHPAAIAEFEFDAELDRDVR